MSPGSEYVLGGTLLVVGAGPGEVARRSRRSAGIVIGSSALTFAPPVFPTGYLPVHEPGAATRMRNSWPTPSFRFRLRAAWASIATWVRTWRPASGWLMMWARSRWAQTPPASPARRADVADAISMFHALVSAGR